MYAISASVFNGSVAICMRYMRTGIHYSLSPFYFSVSCAIIAPFMYSLNTNWNNSHDVAKEDHALMGTKYDSLTCMLVGMVSLFAFTGQLFVSRAYQLEKANVIAPLVYV